MNKFRLAVSLAFLLFPVNTHASDTPPTLYELLHDSPKPLLGDAFSETSDSDEALRTNALKSLALLNKDQILLDYALVDTSETEKNLLKTALGYLSLLNKDQLRSLNSELFYINQEKWIFCLRNRKASVESSLIEHPDRYNDRQKAYRLLIIWYIGQRLKHTALSKTI